MLTKYIQYMIHNTVYIQYMIHNTVYIQYMIHNTVYIQYMIHNTVYIQYMIHNTVYIQYMIINTVYIQYMIHNTVYIQYMIINTVYIQYMFPMGSDSSGSYNLNNRSCTDVVYRRITTCMCASPTLIILLCKILSIYKCRPYVVFGRTTKCTWLSEFHSRVLTI